MAPPPWIWIIVAWLIARDTKLFKKILSWKKQSQDSQPQSKSSPKRAERSKTWTDRLSDTLPQERTVLYAVLIATLLLWSSSPNDQSTQSHDETSFTLQPASFSSSSSEADIPPTQDAPAVDLKCIHNSTLGFAQIFVVNLPERADKRDAMTLTAALTGLKLTWTRAVRGRDVPDKALPLSVTRDGWHDGGIGSWRSQMNVIRSIVEDNLSSALILEDDADWDVRIKDQLLAMAEGTRLLLDRAHSEPAFAAARSPLDGPSPLSLSIPHSPYGDGWDILWLGHCGETFPERIPGHHRFLPGSARYTYYALNEDETLVAAEHAESWIAGDLRRHPGTRWVHFSGSPTCSAAYALSQAGARKVLHALSVGGSLIEQLDNAMARLCRDHTPWDVGEESDGEGPPGYPGARMRCLSVTPAVFSQHKPRGRMDAGSDIETVEGGERVRERGESPNLVWSARLNVGNLMHGLPMEDQFKSMGRGVEGEGERVGRVDEVDVSEPIEAVRVEL